MSLVDITYDRERAVAYAHEWAFDRNPKYGNFSGIGGDCANFASQCLFAGVGVMNYKPLYGWYYHHLNDRTPSWTGVQYLYNFLIGNGGPGPYATETDLSGMQPGDIIQIATGLPDFHHTLVVVKTGERPDRDNVLIACHSYDSDERPLSSYQITRMRCLHVLGGRR